MNFLARDATGKEWAFDVSGGFTSTRAGLKRTDTLWKALGKAAVLAEARQGVPLVLLTTDAPTKGSAGDAALRVVLGPGKPIYDVVELLSAEGQERLHRYASEGPARVSDVAGGPRVPRVAWAVVYDDPAQVFVATDEFVLTRLLALKVVARTSPASLGDRDRDLIREALLEERWAEAIAMWVTATDTRLDAFPDEDLWTEEAVDEELVSLQVRLSPIFEDPDPPGD